MTHKCPILMSKVFVLEGNKILVLRRSETDPRWPLVWDLPGGAIEYDEDPKMAAIRETSEEAGIEVDELQLLDISSLSDGDYAITITYTTLHPGAPVRLSFEHDLFQWVSIDEFMELNIPEKYKIAASLITSPTSL
jgi:8-oxo-dGTP diphosphatase